MQGNQLQGVLSNDTAAGILTCAYVRGSIPGIDLAAKLLSKGAVACELSIEGVAVAFSSPRKAVKTLVDVVSEYPNRLSAGMATGEVENELSRLKLLDEAQGIAGLSEPGQVLLSLGTLELVRQTLDQDATFVDLGTRPLANSGLPTRVFALVVPGLNGARPPEVPKRPWFGHRFIGRVEEIERVVDAVTQFRLVMLVGPTGIGKTALAARVELEIQDQFEGGSFWVDLKLVSRPVLLVHRLAQALEIHSTQDKTLLNQVARRLGESEVLLIFDGVDAVQESVAELCEHLLIECPNLSILVTGTRRLNSNTELTIPLEGLQRPAPGEPVEAVKEYDAIRVFAEEATSFDPSFSVTSQNAEALCAIADIVDGSPWALKMAASRLSVLSPQQLLSRLRENPLGLLHDRDNGLEKAMRGSLAILSPWAQVLFRRLSAFSGPFDAEAIEEVCTYDERLPRSAVLAAMREVHEAHLIQPFHSPRQSRAFYLSPLTLELSTQLCRDASEVGDLGRAQTRYLSAKVQQAISAISTGRAEALADFDLLYEDMRGAWIKRLRARGGSEVAKAVVGIYPYWFQRGYYTEALDMASRIFGTRGVEKIPEYVRVLLLATWACIFITDYRQATIYGRLAVRQIIQKNGSNDFLARALTATGCVAIEVNRPRTAYRLLKVAADLAKENCDPATERVIRQNFAMSLKGIDELDLAEEVFLGLAESSQRSGWVDLTVLISLADLRLDRGDPPGCWQRLLSACDQYEVTPDPMSLSSLYSTAAWTCVDIDKFADARSLLQAYDDIVTFYGLALSPKRLVRKQKLEWALQGRRSTKEKWDPTEPTKLLKAIAIRNT